MTESTAIPASIPASTPVIVVGVGPEEVESALDFAAEEAIRARCGLHLVHAVHVSPPGPENALLTAVDVEKWGREVLDLAVKRAEDLVDGAVPVTHELHRGAPVHVLVEAGRSARMVVLEHRHLSRLSRIVNRTVAGGVAARLPVPVVAVPSGWTPTDGPKVVVAGVDVPERSDEVLRTAVAEAHARGASLKVVHAWSWPAYDAEATSYNDERQRWSDRSRAEVRAALDRLGDESVAMEADVEVHPGRVIEAILGASEGADLLVIGRHDPLVPVGSHIGPVARAVLREAACPVLLANPRPHRAVYHP
ncbi:universal stress protein [Nocardioides lacusdianchii]|uniref:universal stress protein n=1 Tax=Nocardioides lacusdianchii TaxID=2783664 RepID=UPI001CCCA37A|nr:universal stress protein [Nocardioides lacusdianchii]